MRFPWSLRKSDSRPENAEPDSRAADVEWHRKEHDEEDNEKGRPPETEEIRQHCIWVVEAFPPSKIEALKNGLQTLGWSAETPLDEDPVSWLADTRQSAWGGAWLNLGHIVAENSENQWYPRRKVGILPGGIQFASGLLHQPVPSVTFAAFRFVFALDGGVDRALEAALRQKYETTTRQLPNRRYAILTPENQKIDAVRQVRRDLRRRCERWVAGHFPGFFSSLSGDSGFPTCELISLAELNPFERLETRTTGHYLWVLRLDHGFHAWQSDSLPGLRLGQTVDSRGSEEPWAWILAGKWSQIFSDEALSKGHGGRTRAGVVAAVDMIFRESLVRLSLWAFLLEWSHQLSSLRDSVAGVDLRKSVTATTALSKLQIDVVGQSRDLLPILNEVKRMVEDEHWFMHNVCEFIRVERKFRPDPLFASLRESIRRHLDALRDLETAVRESITVSSTALQTISQDKLADVNLRLQVSMKRLTIVGIVLAVFALVVGLPSALPQWKSWLSFLWSLF